MGVGEYCTFVLRTSILHTVITSLTFPKSDRGRVCWLFELDFSTVVAPSDFFSW